MRRCHPVEMNVTRSIAGPKSRHRTTVDTDVAAQVRTLVCSVLLSCSTQFVTTR